MKALILVDIQNDFLPGGALPVKNGNEIIPILNELMKLDFDAVVATKDWHPKNHGSFASNQKKRPGERVTLAGLDQILWEDHCVQGTWGAEFSSNLNTKLIEEVFYKGVDADVDSYSTFYDNGGLRSTGLDEFLRKKGIKTVFIAGLATDYCVLFSAKDAARLGFDTYVILDACRPVELQKGDVEKALEEMQKVGTHIITSKDLLEKSL